MSDNHEGPERRNGTIFERHLQTGIQAVLVGLTLWVGSSILGIREDVAVLRERSAQQSLKIDAMGIEIKALLDSRRQLLDQYESRIRTIESRVEYLEKRK